MKTTQYFSLALCLLSLNACHLFKKEPAQQTSDDMKQTHVITDRKWKLVELQGQPVADKINGKEPFILLQKKDNRYSASGGCNGMGGTFTLQDHGRIKFSQPISTMMACENMDIEHGLSQALMTADNYSLSGDHLSLNKARMAPLARFKAVK